tara:strand:- start:5270 stop:6502 length:1233 start_codon:yes stop_codon:yes gene_type:complete
MPSIPSKSENIERWVFCKKCNLNYDSENIEIAHTHKLHHKELEKELEKEKSTIDGFVESKFVECKKCDSWYNASIEENRNIHENHYFKRCSECYLTYDHNNSELAEKHASEVRCEKCHEVYIFTNSKELEKHINEEICKTCHRIYNSKIDPYHEDNHPDTIYCAGCKTICSIANYNLHHHEHDTNPRKARRRNKNKKNDKPLIPRLPAIPVNPDLNKLPSLSDDDFDYEDCSKLIESDKNTNQNQAKKMANTNDEDLGKEFLAIFANPILSTNEIDELFDQIKSVLNKKHVQSTTSDNSIHNSSSTTTIQNGEIIRNTFSLPLQAVIGDKKFKIRHVKVAKNMKISFLKYRICSVYKISINDWDLDLIFNGKLLTDDKEEVYNIINIPLNVGHSLPMQIVITQKENYQYY